MKILIDSVNVKVKSGTSKAGKEYKIREQSGYLDKGERFPEKCVINLEGDQQPHPPGEYTIDLEQSVYVGRFGGIELSSSPVLLPVSKTQAAVDAKGRG